MARKVALCPRGGSWFQEWNSRSLAKGRTPALDSAQTLAVAGQVDDSIAQIGLNRTPRFREARAARNATYLKTWIAGCTLSGW